MIALKRFLKAVLILVVLFAAGFFVPTDYYLVMPSRAVDLGSLITVENAEPGDQSVFYLVTVTQQRAALSMLPYGFAHPHIDVKPAYDVIPEGYDMEKYREILLEYMDESRHMAQLVALRRAGYEVEVLSDGVEIAGMFEDAPAEGVLETGDIIKAVDGTEVLLASEVPILVQDRRVGDTVDLVIVRDGLEQDVSVTTGPKTDDEEVPFLGIFIKTLDWEPVTPVEIIMDTGNIGGPSAGMMFALEILNQLLPGDLAAGKKVAGTGTIGLNEIIGKVGGVKQKVVAAEIAGADYFLVAEGNYEEAMKAARQIEIVPVENLGEALDFLTGVNGT